MKTVSIFNLTLYNFKRHTICFVIKLYASYSDHNFHVFFYATNIFSTFVQIFKAQEKYIKWFI